MRTMILTLIGLLWQLSDLIYVKFIEWCPPHGTTLQLFAIRIKALIQTSFVCWNKCPLRSLKTWDYMVNMDVYIQKKWALWMGKLTCFFFFNGEKSVFSNSQVWGVLWVGLSKIKVLWAWITFNTVKWGVNRGRETGGKTWISCTNVFRDLDILGKKSDRSFSHLFVSIRDRPNSSIQR